MMECSGLLTRPWRCDGAHGEGRRSAGARADGEVKKRWSGLDRGTGAWTLWSRPLPSSDKNEGFARLGGRGRTAAAAGVSAWRLAQGPRADHPAFAAGAQPRQRGKPRVPGRQQECAFDAPSSATEWRRSCGLRHVIGACDGRPDGQLWAPVEVARDGVASPAKEQDARGPVVRSAIGGVCCSKLDAGCTAAIRLRIPTGVDAKPLFAAERGPALGERRRQYGPFR